MKKTEHNQEYLNPYMVCDIPKHLGSNGRWHVDVQGEHPVF